MLEERSLRITELEGEVAALAERLAAAEAAAELERAAFEEKSTKLKAMLQVCRSATADCGPPHSLHPRHVQIGEDPSVVSGQ